MVTAGLPLPGSAGALAVTALAFFVEGVFAGVQRLLTPKALRQAEGPADLLVPVIEGT